MRRKVIRMIIIFLLMAVLCSVNVFAITHTVNSFESNNNYTLCRSIQGDSYYAVTLRTSSPGDMSDFVDKINETYKLFRNIALPIAGLGIAYCGFALIFGSEKDAEISKKRIFYIALAIAVLFLLPAIINSVVDLVSQFAWDPESPAS